MKYVVNLRGINASGKSTAVRQFCEENKMAPDSINFNGIEWKVMTNGRFTAIGHYKPYSKSEGCDALKCGKEEFKKFIRWLLKAQKPELVIYEKQIWSTTYKLTSEVAEISKSAGYQFIAVQMCVEYQDALNRLLKRNGGDLGNLEHFDTRFYGTYNARKNLKKNGFTVYDVRVMELEEKSMYSVITSAIKMHETGKRSGYIEKIIE